MDPKREWLKEILEDASKEAQSRPEWMGEGNLSWRPSGTSCSRAEARDDSERELDTDHENLD